MRRRCDGALTGHAGAFRPSQQRLPPSPARIEVRTPFPTTGMSGVLEIVLGACGFADTGQPESVHHPPSRNTIDGPRGPCGRSAVRPAHGRKPPPTRQHPAPHRRSDADNLHRAESTPKRAVQEPQPRLGNRSPCRPTKRRRPATIEDEAGSAGSETPVATRKC